MSHTHGGTDPGHDSHGGSRGLGWELLDSIMLGCGIVVAGLLAEVLIRQWRARKVRYDLTPAGLAVTEADVARRNAEFQAEVDKVAEEFRERDLGG